MSNKQEFVNVYDEFRDAVLNKEYYARRIERSRVILKRLDVFLALFAGGSGVLSFGLWKFEFAGLLVGPLLLSLVTGVAIVLGIARPYLKLEDELERLSSIQGAYSAIAHVLEDIVRKIKTEKDVDDTSKTVYQVLRQVRSTLGAREDVPADRKLIDEMQKIVNQRYPAETFFYPDEK